MTGDDVRKTIAEIAGYDPTSPAVVGARTDAAEYARLIDALVALRRASGLNQTSVAAVMGTKQSAVSELERTGSNPRIRTLFRYARAVGADLRFAKPMPRAVFSVTSSTVATTVTDEPIVSPAGAAVASTIAA